MHRPHEPPLHKIFTPFGEIFTPPIGPRHYYRLAVVGLLVLALVGVAVALALGFAISIWWLGPPRNLVPHGAGVDPAGSDGALPPGAAGTTDVVHAASAAGAVAPGTGGVEPITPITPITPTKR